MVIATLALLEIEAIGSFIPKWTVNGAVKDYIKIWMIYCCCLNITWDTSLPRHYNHDQIQIDQCIFTSSPYSSGSSGLMDLTGTYSLSMCQVCFTCLMFSCYHMLSPFQGHLHPQHVLNSPSEKTTSRSPVLPSSYGKTLGVLHGSHQHQQNHQHAVVWLVVEPTPLKNMSQLG